MSYGSDQEAVETMQAIEEFRGSEQGKTRKEGDRLEAEDLLRDLNPHAKRKLLESTTEEVLAEAARAVVESNNHRKPPGVVFDALVTNINNQRTR